MKIFFLKFEIFFENHPPTRQYKVQENKYVLRQINKSIMANLLTNLERFLRRIKSPLTRYKLAKMATFKPP